jgi:hypothetical protein
MTDNDKLYNGMIESIAENLLSFFGISEEQVDKVKAIIDNIDIKQENNQTVIDIKIKNIKITIEK